MAKKGSSSVNKASSADLTLTTLLRYSRDYKSIKTDPLCKTLLGDMYQEILEDMSTGLKSDFRNGKSAKQHRCAAEYLKNHSEIRDHILKIWEKWQPYPNRGTFSTEMLSIQENTSFDDAGTPEQAAQLKQWLRRMAESDDTHDQAELMTTLTLLACTIGHWHETAPLCLPKTHSVPTAGPLPQETALLKQIQEAEGREDFETVTQLLQKLIKENLCRSSSLGAYYYRLSLAWGQRRDRAVDQQQRKEYSDQVQRALDMACDYEHPEALLQAAKNAYTRYLWQQCYDYCERAVQAGRNTPTGGEACWYLYLLGKENHAPPLWQERAAGYLKQAGQWGYPEAVKKYREENAVTLSDQLPQSLDSSTGVFCINTDNEYARTILVTKPDSWIQSSDSMTQAPRDRIPRKYFFLDDDHARNISQALRLLQSIKNSGSQNPDIAIYLRAPEEQAAPLIDTALTCMTDTVIPVRILDDDRLAARVLGYHPLYYPIRNLPPDAGAKLNFVVIGDSRCCEWLVREAFWMTTFRNRQIGTKITILAPHATELFERLLQHCPAMDASRNQPNVHSGDQLTRNFPYIRAVDCGYESRQFQKEIEELLPARNIYIAVDAGSDLENMELATSLREKSVRTAVRNDSIRSDTMPTITFRCADTDIASLSRRTVVLSEASGSLWYNNYNLIPFGVTGALYSWDGLTRDLVEELSLDIHMVYCGIDPKADRSSQGWTDARKSYLQRSYNRDSSIAVALSLGYRLYQCNYHGTGPVLPEFWDILDRDAIFSDQGLKRLAEKLGSGPQTLDSWTDLYKDQHIAVYEGSCTAETLAVAKWEHDRWNRFMISRGWMSATTEQMRTYMAAGNQRQQLYIGRLHPFICPFEDLEKLEKELDKSIREYDVQNIRMTGPILTRQWTQPQRTLERSLERAHRERAR